MPDRFIYTMDDVLNMLDALLVDRGGQWWDEFFADRSKPCPFFVDWPDAVDFSAQAIWCASGRKGGSGYTDQQVYERASLGGGLGYSADRLHALWDAPPFSLLALRPMNKTDGQGPCFGEDFLWALLAAKESSGGR